MNENEPDAQSTIHELTEAGREKLAQAQSGAQDALSAATEYIRANPWVAVAGAAVLGGVIAVLSKSSKPEPRNLDAVRDWLDEAYSKLPSQKQVQSIADSSGIPCFLKSLKKKLNLS